MCPPSSSSSLSPAPCPADSLHTWLCFSNPQHLTHSIARAGSQWTVLKNHSFLLLLCISTSKCWRCPAGISLMPPSSIYVLPWDGSSTSVSWASETIHVPTAVPCTLAGRLSWTPDRHKMTPIHLHPEWTGWCLEVVHNHLRFGISNTEVIKLPDPLHPTTHIPFSIPSSGSPSSQQNVFWTPSDTFIKCRVLSDQPLKYLLSLLHPFQPQIWTLIFTFLNYCSNFLPGLPRTASTGDLLFNRPSCWSEVN